MQTCSARQLGVHHRCLLCLCAAPASVQGHPLNFDSGSEGPGSAPMSRSGSEPGTPPGSVQGHPVAFDSGSAGLGSAAASRMGSEDMGSVQVRLPNQAWLISNGMT